MARVIPSQHRRPRTFGWSYSFPRWIPAPEMEAPMTDLARRKTRRNSKCRLTVTLVRARWRIRYRAGPCAARQILVIYDKPVGCIEQRTAIVLRSRRHARPPKKAGAFFSRTGTAGSPLGVLPRRKKPPVRESLPFATQGCVISFYQFAPRMAEALHERNLNPRG